MTVAEMKPEESRPAGERQGPRQVSLEEKRRELLPTDTDPDA